MARYKGQGIRDIGKKRGPYKLKPGETIGKESDPLFGAKKKPVTTKKKKP